MSTTANWGVPYVASTDAIGGYPSISSSLANKVDTLADHFDSFFGCFLKPSSTFTLTSSQQIFNVWSSIYTTNGYNMTFPATIYARYILIPAYYNLYVDVDLEADSLSDNQNFASDVYVATSISTNNTSISAKISEAGSNGYATASHSFVYPYQSGNRYLYVGGRSTNGGGVISTNSTLTLLMWKHSI